MDNGCGLDNNWSAQASVRASQMAGEQHLKTPMDPPMRFKYIEQASKPMLRMGHSILHHTHAVHYPMRLSKSALRPMLRMCPSMHMFTVISLWPAHQHCQSLF